MEMQVVRVHMVLIRLGSGTATSICTVVIAINISIIDS
jgi:hypothetical protein